MIAPTSAIYLMKNVPLYPDYVDTVSYADATSQFNDLTSGATILNNYTYVRQTNSIKVGLAIGKVFDVNYLAYKNTEYENKWIYCFVTRVEYVNDNVSELFFEIDVMQTFFLFGRYLLGQQYVERTHTATDNLGEHYLEEGLPTGTYEMEGYQKAISTLSTLGIVVAVSDTSSDKIGLYEYENVFSGAKLYGFLASDRASILTLLSGYTAKPEAVTNIYVVPWVLIADKIDSKHEILDGVTPNQYTYYLGSTLQGTEDFGGYTPKNKKLYCYPYNFFHIINNTGEKLDLRYEFFDNFRPCVNIRTTLLSPVTLALYPARYKGVGTDSSGNWQSLYSEKLLLSNFPLCSWSNDSYSQWVATQAVPTAVSSVWDIIKTVVGIKTGSTTALASGVISCVDSAVNTINSMYQANQSADVLVGNTGGSNVNISNGEHNFFASRCHITAEYAKVLDNYFDKYGYKVNQNMVLNLRARPYWTYIKTIAADVQVSCPAQYKEVIDNALNRGVTFWKDKKASVGLYGRDNSPA